MRVGRDVHNSRRVIAPRQRQRALLLGLVAVLAAVVGIAVAAAGWLDRVERTTLDARYALRGERAAPADLLIVAVDDATLRDLETRWPFSRSVQARALERIAAGRPRAIGYDIQLSESTTSDDDEAIARAVLSTERLVLATALTDAVNGPNLIFYDEDLAAAGVRVGHAGFPHTPGNVFRTVPLRVDGLASFAVAVAETAAAGPVSAADFAHGALIDYRGPPGTVRAVHYSEVLSGAVPPSAFDDMIVIVGATAPQLGDVHPTPMGDVPMSGPEINANAVATILDGFPLRTAPGWLDVLLIVVLAALGAAAAWPRRAWVGVIAAAATGVAFLLVAYLLFRAGVVVEVTAPLVALVVATAGGLAAVFGILERERARLRTEFARFVPAAVVDEVVERAGGDQRLGGRRIYCTVMFADLRGFTAAAERLPPEMVIEVLNRYLTEMSDVILDAGGTLVSYMGDGIMALFGAPLEQDDHADRAVAAARRMRDESLPRFNEWYAGRMPGEAFSMGIGVASGPVMSGNVGSASRLEYAAVGDTTNMASRLQTLTKDGPHSVLISDATRAALMRPVPDLRAVGALEVRGRQVPASVWTIDADPVSRA